ncbi:cellulose synthase-like protein H1 isoform X2 [Abrus precatorius]|uniref:Cellulose synthase-like protein H1 isoform X2 n=1 Tax=Abrus precatorius TaxID=3816 RepID=A0A8B8KNX9_ABRPR|nr:cellulose synthase-like protein H1 isoform X2 [Abrus precatorius]
MANQHSLFLYEKQWYKQNYKRVTDSLLLILLLLLLCYRVISVNYYSFPWFVALCCESWFTISWFFTLTTQWNPAIIETYPDRLLQRVQELPAVDLFVTTADPMLEPPIITVNTVLSLLALDYPAHKLACYVSDDGCSPLTFYALQEASEFAKFWVPFCKKYEVQVRAPFRYFSDEPEASKANNIPEFRQEWLRTKDMYDLLSRRIELEASRKCRLDGEFAVFSNTEKTNHPTIIKVLWENKECLADGLPHLIYISREKRPKQPHHFKAGAMNVLARVSGLMTNAPFMLNVDCDMIVNNPKIVLHGLCVLLDSKGEKEVAFAQCPQQFYAALKDDPFGNQLVILFKHLAAGLAGIQGPFYGGTNCLHRRKVIYGLSPDNVENGNSMSEEELKQKFGASKEVVKSAAHALKGRTYSPNHINISKAVEVASQVAGYGYEYGTAWGKQVGWRYGSLTEDVLTGLKIHVKGWRSELCTPNPIAFTGFAPGGGPTSMAQQKRWATGVLEIFFSKHCPIIGTLFHKLTLRECFAYMWITNWGLGPIFEVSYACLIAYCIITNSNFLPQDMGMCIPVACFVIYAVYTLLEYLAAGMSIREWWNNQRMSRITPMNAGFCAFLTVILKLLRISNTVFDITKKDVPSHARDGGEDKDAGRYTFDESLVFLPGTTILLMQLVAIVIKLLGLQPTHSGNGCGLGEIFCSVYLIVCYWPFLRGLFERGKYRIPLSTVCKSAILTCFFVHLCRKNNAG